MNKIYYYQLNGKVLEFDTKKDSDLILINHYIMQKENLQRLKGNLNRGQFETSSSTISKDTGINVSKVKRCINKLIDLGILTVIDKSNHRGKPSIYEYVSSAKKYAPVTYNKVAPVEDYDSNVSESGKVTNEPINEPSVKETEKSISVIDTDDLTLKSRMMVLDNYKIDFKLNKRQQILIKDYSIDVFEKAVKTFVASGKDSFQYFYGILNRTVVKVSSVINSDESRKNNNLSNKNTPQKCVVPKHKTRFHNINQTFTKYDENELEQILLESQRDKGMFKPSFSL